MPENYDIPIWGEHMNKPTYRFVPIQGYTLYQHSIGGKDWKHIDIGSHHDPMLMLTIDFRDPHFAQFQSSGLVELPIVFFEENPTADISASYHVSKNRIITFLYQNKQMKSEIDLVEKNTGSLDVIPCIIDPLPIDQFCVNEENYWTACEAFWTCGDRDGNPSVIRILGEPVWSQWVFEEFCEYGSKMDYVVSIGYDVSNNSKLSPGKQFMFIEGGMYFFFCQHCCNIHMITQST